MSTSVLSRITQSSFRASAELNPLQSQVDGLVGHFVEEATNPITLASMTAGGLAYRMGRVGVMSVASTWGGHVAAMPLRIASMAVGLGSEVTAFELTNRALQTVRAHGPAPLQTQNPNLWSWSGPGGWAQGLASSAVTFGMLRGAGFLVREENFALQHAFQSTAMVTGHNTVGILGILPRPDESLGEQFLQAEVTNLQMMAGMGLAQGVAPGISAFERSMDVAIQAVVEAGGSGRVDRNRTGQEGLNPFGLQMATGGTSPRALPSRPCLPAGRERELNLNIMMAENRQKEGGSSGPVKSWRKEFWYPIRSSKKLSLEVDYSGEHEKQMERLEAQIRRANEGLDTITTRQELLSRRPNENLVNAVWFHQLRHLVRSLGLEPKEFMDPEQLLAPLEPGLVVENPRALRAAVRRMREEGLGEDAFRVLEFDVPYEDILFGRPDRKERSTGLLYILESIEGELRNTVRIGQAEKGTGHRRVRLMSPSLFERLLQVVHGPEAPVLFYVEGMISRDQSMRLKVLGASPIGMSRASLRLEDLQVRVPAWIFSLHDLYHASMITNFPRTLREYIGKIYFQVLGDQRLRRSPFLREHLDRLSDMDPPIEAKDGPITFFGHTLGHLATHYRKDSESDRLTMGRILQYRKFLNDYRDLLTRDAPQDPHWARWQAEFKGEIENMFEKFQRMIGRIARAYADFLKQK